MIISGKGSLKVQKELFWEDEETNFYGAPTLPGLQNNTQSPQ